MRNPGSSDTISESSREPRAPLPSSPVRPGGLSPQSPPDILGTVGQLWAGVGRCGHMAVTWAAQVLGIGDTDATSGSVAQAELRPLAAEPAGCAARPDSAPSGEGKASGGLRASLWPSWTIAPDTDSGLFPDHPQESGVTPDALV